jgi:anti-sigma B factor antagonist
MTAQSTYAFACELDSEHQVMVVTLIGKMDPLVAEQLSPHMEEAFHAGVRRFVFDMTRLDYVGSLGLRLFVDLHNRVKGVGAVVLCQPTAAVRTILEMTKLNRYLRAYPTRREAVDATQL